MAAKTNIYTFPLWLAFLAMSFPMIFSFIKKDDKPNLTGIVISDVKPELNSENWFSGSYQTDRDDYNNDHWSLKEISVRLNNQFYYDAFNQIRVNGFVNGKDNYVISENFIYAAYGDDFIGEEKIKEQVRKAKVVQDTLKKKGIDLMFVFAPGKGSYCSEFVSDKYKHPVKNTNKNEFVKQCLANGTNHLDLATWYMKMKPTTEYPLFTRFGHHWSYFGDCLSISTIIGYMETLHGKKMNQIIWKDIVVSDTARSRDADVLKSMNLYSNPPQNMKLAYPEVGFEQDSLKNIRVLTIGDSYWYGPVYMGVPENCFGNGQFWYYNNKVIPSPVPGEKVEAWQLDLKTSIEQHEIIMLMYSDGTLSNFGNGFIENAYELYTSPKTYYEKVEKNKVILSYAKQIRETPGLLKKVTLLSNDRQISLDSAIKSESRKMAGIK